MSDEALHAACQRAHVLLYSLGAISRLAGALGGLLEHGPHHCINLPSLCMHPRTVLQLRRPHQAFPKPSDYQPVKRELLVCICADIVIGSASVGVSGKKRPSKMLTTAIALSHAPEVRWKP